MGVILSALVALTAVAGGAMSIAQATGKFGPKTMAKARTMDPAVFKEPTIAKAAAMPAVATEEARREEMARRRRRTQTLLTGPAGALGQAQTVKKVLLGA